MIIKESSVEETLPSKNIHDITAEEDEETLSLCDLPLYSNQTTANWEESFSIESQESSSISDQDYFEFFSQEMNPSTTTTATSSPENIIFCGKLIHNKQPDTILKRDSSRQIHEKKKGGLSRKELSSKKTYDNEKHEKGFDFPIHKMSILASTRSGKTSWYFFLFGSSRISTEVEWRDMKNRQSRHQFTSPPSSLAFGFPKDDVFGDKNRGWGLWGLIRALSCSGNHHHHPHNMAVVPISCEM